MLSVIRLSAEWFFFLAYKNGWTEARLISQLVKAFKCLQRLEIMLLLSKCEMHSFEAYLAKCWATETTFVIYSI